MTAPRLLVLMGSGETSPTMVKTHRRVFGRLDDARCEGPAVLLDTPFGFQENADDIASKAVGYFRDSVGREVTVAGWRRAGGDAVEAETALAALRRASWVFAGPGSPTYALRNWRDTPVPASLLDLLRQGGAVTFASAAALTAGAFTVPVYEIYKCGEEPRWEPGLDLLGELLGWQVAVVPHFDNAEGGGHDTRYCYLGERRLAQLEPTLPPDGFVLGVDEHTGLILDLGAGTAEVVGVGGVTVRRGGRSSVVPAGSTVDLAAVPALVEAAGPGPERHARPPMEEASPGAAGVGAAPALSLLDAVRAHERAFDDAIDARDVGGAVRAVLAADDELTAWAADTQESDERDRARSVVRSMVVRLGEVAVRGAADPRDVLSPLVEPLLVERAAARAARDWAASDRIRDALAAAGVEVRDTPEGAEWVLVP